MALCSLLVVLPLWKAIHFLAGLVPVAVDAAFWIRPYGLVFYVMPVVGRMAPVSGVSAHPPPV